MKNHLFRLILLFPIILTAIEEDPLPPLPYKPSKRPYRRIFTEPKVETKKTLNPKPAPGTEHLLDMSHIKSHKPVKAEPHYHKFLDLK